MGPRAELLQVLLKPAGGVVFPLSLNTYETTKNVCVCLGAREPTSYQENGAKETEAGDRKLEEEAAPIVRAQHGSYGNHS